MGAMKKLVQVRPDVPVEESPYSVLFELSEDVERLPKRQAARQSGLFVAPTVYQVTQSVTTYGAYEDPI